MNFTVNPVKSPYGGRARRRLLCYNPTVYMSNHSVLTSNRLRRIALLVPVVPVLFLVASCGSSNNSTSTSTSNVKNRAFISNTYSGALQIVDTQTDKTALTATTTNSAGQQVAGSPVTIAVSTSVTLESLSPNLATTAVYNPNSQSIYFLTNSSETVATSTGINSGTGQILFSPDSTQIYVPEPNAAVSGQRNGLVQNFAVSTAGNTTNFPISAARYVAISPNGQYLLVFSDNSDSLTVLNLTANPVTYTSIPGFAAPINAFFNTDSNTAYVLNCGPECGSSNPASVMQLDIGAQAIKATVPVGGASVGLLNGTTLYVAGSPVPPGTTSTYDAVNISNMTRITANSVAIGDGFHTTMALSTNNKLYIGANSCNNTTTGCLSVVNTATNTADAPLPPRGAITSLLAIKGRDVVYAIEGGYLQIYDTDTDTLQNTQIIFTGALYDIVQVDQ